MFDKTKSTANAVYTVCFADAGCTRDEGERTRKVRDKNIYAKQVGYIPVRMQREIAGKLEEFTNSISVRGVGENDWAFPDSTNEPLLFNGPLKLPSDLLSYCKDSKCAYEKSPNRKDSVALAVHGANKALLSQAKQFNFVGHGLGAVSAMMAAWFIHAYGPSDVKVNILAIDPTPGLANWWSIMTKLSPNVANYVGVYAWDECAKDNKLTNDDFDALIPYPNHQMTTPTNATETNQLFSIFGSGWSSLGDSNHEADPLKSNTLPQPVNYKLYCCRGKHNTLGGNITTDAQFNPLNDNSNISIVPKLVYKMARAYLESWGTEFSEPCAITEDIQQLRLAMNDQHGGFDAMGGGIYRTSDTLNMLSLVRQVSSSSGINPEATEYLGDVVGIPPYQQYYPVTTNRKGAGWVEWSFL